jgi:AcrR family transcriptional regulator
MSVSRSFKGVSADARKADRRERLREAALDLVGDRGVAGATVNAICEQAGLTKRYFYESYSDREELLLELLDDLFNGIRDGIVEAVADAPKKVEVRARRTAEVLLSRLDADRRAARLYVESVAEPVLYARREQAFDEFAGMLAEHVVRLDPKRPEVDFAAHVVVAGVTDVVSRWLTGEKPWTHDGLAEAITRLGVTVSRL